MFLASWRKSWSNSTCLPSWYSFWDSSHCLGYRHKCIESFCRGWENRCNRQRPFRKSRRFWRWVVTFLVGYWCLIWRRGIFPNRRWAESTTGFTVWKSRGQHSIVRGWAWAVFKNRAKDSAWETYPSRSHTAPQAYPCP